MKFVTVKQSHYQQDLIVLKSRLESEGIECRFKNELTTQVLNYLPAFLIELQVADTDLDRVKEIMIETGEWQEGNTKVVCQHCGSEKIKMKLSNSKKIKLFFSVIFVLILHTLPMDKMFRNVKYVCKECGTEIKE